MGAKLFNPRHEVGIAHVTFGTVTDRATWYAIIKRVTLMAVDAVDAVVPAMNRWRVFGFSSAVVARLTGESMNLVLGQHKQESALLGTSGVTGSDPVDAMVLTVPLDLIVAPRMPCLTGVKLGTVTSLTHRAGATSKAVRGALKRVATIALGSPNDIPLASTPARVTRNGDFAEALISQVFTLKAPSIAATARGKRTAPRTLPDGTTIALDSPYWRTRNIAPARPAQDGDFTLAQAC